MRLKSSRTIKIPAKTDHLSDVIAELPINCLFNKGRVGCGGTTIALQNSIPTVVCVPFVHIIESKVDQSKFAKAKTLYPFEVFGIHGGVSDDSLSAYLDTMTKSGGVPKIMVSYDSLHRIVKHTDFDPSKYHILIDEYHCLVTEYSYRKAACLNVLKHYTAFESFTFMTATPINDDHLFEQLTSVDVVEAVWEEDLNLKVVSVECNNGVQRAIIAKINKIKESKLDGNYYFFINAIQFINSIVATCKLDKNNCRIICAEGNEEKLPWKRGKLTDLARKFNFITKTAFEGADLYDEDGHIYILSDAHDHKTMIDVSVQFSQIAGRIRNSKHKHFVHHYFSCVKEADKMTYAEYKDELLQQINEEKNYVAEVQDMKTLRYRIRAAASSNLQYHIVDQVKMDISEDTNAAKFALYSYKLKYHDYSSRVSLIQEYKTNKLFNVEHHIDMSTKDPVNIPLKGDFKTTVIKLKELQNSPEGVMGDTYIEYRRKAFEKYDYLERAIEMLGFERIEKAKYHAYNIRRKVVANTSLLCENSIKTTMATLLEMECCFNDGSALSSKRVKAVLNDCYMELGVNKKATAKDIETYYNVVDTTKKIEGKQQRAVKIVSKKNL